MLHVYRSGRIVCNAMTFRFTPDDKNLLYLIRLGPVSPLYHPLTVVAVYIKSLRREVEYFRTARVALS